MWVFVYDMGDSQMQEVTLIQCVKSKQDEPAPAKDLYDSSYFTLMRQYAESRDVPYFILSAKHRLVKPDRVIKPYDEKGLTDHQAIVIAGHLKNKGVETVRIVAGMGYTNPLVPELETRGIDVIEVAQGLQIGQRMARLKELVDE